MGTTRGTIDFHHDRANDLVVARPRWHLGSAPEVVRWYEMNARYFRGRFSGPKDLVVVHDAFDLSPQLGTLWACYAVKLQDEWVRYTAHVKSSERVRQTTRTSVLRFCLSSTEVSSVEEAIAAIARLREAARPSQAPPRSGFVRTLIGGTAPPVPVKVGQRS